MNSLEVLGPRKELAGLGAPELIGVCDGLLVKLLVALEVCKGVGASASGSSFFQFPLGSRRDVFHVPFFPFLGMLGSGVDWRNGEPGVSRVSCRGSYWSDEACSGAL